MTKEVKIDFEGVELNGILKIPTNVIGLVVFAHGAGSSRLSPRNNYVADVLNKEDIATLLFDLLTEEEDSVYENRFDIPLLTDRLLEVTEWIQGQNDIKDLKLGYFGASTGAASALNAAAELGDRIKAVVSRGGRPDLAMEKLPQVKSPTLLIVGGDDDVVIGLNEKADAALSCEKKLEIIPGATHLFEEPGTLEQAASIAAKWFKKHLK